MFDIGWTEMMVVAVVAILFVGPKELPAMLRTFGRAVKKVRAMAGEFQGQFDEALKDAELDGVKDSINQVRDLDPTKKIKDSLNPLKADIEKAGSDIKQSTEFDPKNFSEDYGKDIEAELDAADTAANTIPPSSGKNAVPGFGPADAPTADAPTKAKLVSKKKTAAATKKATAKKTAVEKAAAKKPAAKPAAKQKSTKAASKTSASKPKTAAKRKPAKKTDA